MGSTAQWVPGGPRHAAVLGAGRRGCRAEQDSDGSAQSTADMTAFVQNLLMQMQTRFQAMSENIISKIDEMGMRIDELEQSINDLKAEMGSDSMTTPSKTKDEGSKPADSSA
ncbi:heat shock factor-binding protein isoform X2 [Setaria viridis]|uniref:heat shock factor-binding protein isoform X2 n=1 Tax=Setaria viridis TaxID=4556 RepID=UPI001493CC69|nr:heat shock factor-binding protein isoform X2 [Setaria viridis]